MAPFQQVLISWPIIFIGTYHIIRHFKVMLVTCLRHYFDGQKTEQHSGQLSIQLFFIAVYYQCALSVQ